MCAIKAPSLTVFAVVENITSDFCLHINLRIHLFHFKAPKNFDDILVLAMLQRNYTLMNTYDFHGTVFQVHKTIYYSHPDLSCFVWL